jgi:transcriptional regulator with XRE-family HTH domain
MSDRAVRHVRKFLGQRVRTLRKQRGLSQERLGDRAGLSGKFIGEVERGEKSISIDSLYRVSVALEIPLRELSPASGGPRTSERRTGSSRRCSVRRPERRLAAASIAGAGSRS